MANEYKSIYSGQEVDNAVATAQKALTTDNLVQTTGPSPNNVMSQSAVTAAIQNIKSGTTVTVNNVAQTTWNADTKINVFQGTENAGKIFTVGQDGNTVLQTIKPVTETFTIESASWSALSDSSPYTYSATVTATTTIGTDSIVELINNQAVLFATYGFAIGNISGQVVTIYSMGQPSESVTLTLGVTG